MSVQPSTPAQTVRPVPRSPDALRVLLVDDDPLFAESLTANLREHGYSAESCTDGEIALDRLAEQAKEDYDLVLLDWVMPNMTGNAFLRRLRETDVATPVLVLTGHDGEFEECLALSLGAADFVDKGRRFSILAKRLELLAQGAKGRAEDNDVDTVSVGGLLLRCRSCRALWQDRELPLTFTEFQIVERLALNAGTATSYREIYDIVHGTGFFAGDGETGYRVNVRSLIKRIRRKFAAADPAFSAIENCPGYGYRWQAEPAV